MSRRPPTPLQVQRAREREARAQEKARRDAYLATRLEQTGLKNAELQKRNRELGGLLEATLPVDDFIDLNTLKRRDRAPAFRPGALAEPIAPPTIEQFLPRRPGIASRLIPGAMHRYERDVDAAHAVFKRAVDAHVTAEGERQLQLDAMKAEHAKKVEAHNLALEAQHREIDELKDAFEHSEPDAVAKYFRMVLDASRYPTGFPQKSATVYVAQSKQLVVEYTFPSAEVVPDAREYRYVRAKDAIEPLAMPGAQKRSSYANVLAQIALRTVHELFEADRTGKIDTIVFNGHVNVIDPATGKPARPCLITLRTTRDVFVTLELGNVEPLACLRKLNASVSKSPAELAPVRPILEFNMLDPRFIETSDVLSQLDQRPNLMQLSPGEFENLITNLFEKMGLETRLTQASRDGGVDCVAYDSRPILGGKVVIQAKRYKNTVGVSAVRDLYGTMQNEGASKGILVTTSGYGQASFQFAGGKPLELIDGAQLLYLLQEHAGIDAKIEPPDDWVDPISDAPELTAP